MTRFLLIADTHWGAGTGGFKVQPKYDEKLPEILTALKSWMAENDPIDFILHGGDMVHHPTHTGIQQAIDLFQFDIPVHLCIGNHDLTIPDCLQDWLSLAPNFFGNNSPNYTVEAKDCIIHVIPNQYCDTPYFWERISEAYFLETQIRYLETQLSARPESPHIILTHSPVLGIPVDRTGFDKPYHVPAEQFTECVTQIAEKFNIPCVLGAHSHVNMNEVQNGVHYITVSSFVETPFEFKLFEIDQSTLKMTTLNLLDRINFDAVYNFDQTFAQGRLCDRTFTKNLK